MHFCQWSWSSFLSVLWVAVFHLGATAAFGAARVSTLADAWLSADAAGGSYSSLTGPVLDEGGTGDIGVGTIILNAPAGFAFDPTASVSVQVSRLAGTGGALKLASGTATVTANAITISVTAVDGKQGCTSRLTWSGIRVRPTAGTPLATGSITVSGSSKLVGITSSTRFGTLAQATGAARQLVLATQPPATAVAGVAFAPPPVVRIEDQFGNLRTNDTLVVSAVANVGGGLLVGATSAAGGIATFTDLAYPGEGNFTLTFTSGSLAPATSPPITVTGLVQLGPVLPPQSDRTIYELTTLVVTNTATDAYLQTGTSAAAPPSSNTIYFNYPSRTELLADGWSFLATNPDGTPRDTEITDPALGAVVSYDQAAHPGVLELPCDVGDLWESLNNSRNSLFRSLPANWVSLQLALSFAPILIPLLSRVRRIPMDEGRE